ncbi:MAG: hypothetical protein JJU41_07665 [Bacteroidetes bacterium]|nr:hypothetical protein [Bacteroidota bacterium]
MKTRIFNELKFNRQYSNNIVYPKSHILDLHTLRALYSPHSIKSVASGKWSSPKTWENGDVPNRWMHVVFIRSGHTVIIDTSTRIHSLIIQPNAALEFDTGMGKIALQFSDGGLLHNKGTFSQGTGILTFNGTGNILGRIIATSDINGGPIILDKESELFIYKSITVGKLIINKGLLHVMKGNTLTATSITLEREGNLY